MRPLLTTTLLVLNLLFWGTPVVAAAFVKLLTFGRARRWVIASVTSLVEGWVAGNNRIFDLLLTTRWSIEGVEDLPYDAHFLVISNHVSWTDIVVLFRALHGRVAFPRFFVKRELIWFPIVGQACWALEFPFMHRYTAEYLERHPEKRGTDLETTRRACQRYRDTPVTILNFVEGTRFTAEKQADQESPYRHLLRPRVGGIAFVLASLGDQLEGLLDATIVYPRREITFRDFIGNRIASVTVRVRRIDIPAEFLAPAVTEPGPVRDRFKEWIESIWCEKDALLDDLRGVTSR